MKLLHLKLNIAPSAFVSICVRIDFGIRFDSVILLLVCIICLFMWLLFFFYLIFYGVHVLLDHLMLVVHVFGDIWFSFPFLYSLFYCCTHKFWFDKGITVGLSPLSLSLSLFFNFINRNFLFLFCAFLVLFSFFKGGGWGELEGIWNDQRYGLLIPVVAPRIFFRMIIKKLKLHKI